METKFGNDWYNMFDLFPSEPTMAEDGPMYPDIELNRGGPMYPDIESNRGGPMYPDMELGLNGQIIEVSGSPINVTGDYNLGFNESSWIFGEAEDLIILPILLSLIFMCALFGNILVIFAVLAHRRMRTGTNLMLLNISMCDVVFITFCIPTAVLNHVSPSGMVAIPGIMLCKFVHYIIFVTVYVSTYTLVVICVFRFFCEYMFANLSSLLSRGNAIISCFVIWLAFIVSHLNFLIQENAAIFQEPFICVHTLSVMDQSRMKTLWVTFLSCAFLLPLITICVLSAAILRHQKKVYKHNERIEHETRPHSAYENSKIEKRNKRQITMLVMAVVIVRSICWLPIQAFIMIDIFGLVQVSELYRKAEMIGVCFAFIGACVSPLVYNCVSQEFRSAYHETFARLGCVS